MSSPVYSSVGDRFLSSPEQHSDDYSSPSPVDSLNGSFTFYKNVSNISGNNKRSSVINSLEGSPQQKKSKNITPENSSTFEQQNLSPTGLVPHYSSYQCMPINVPIVPYVYPQATLSKPVTLKNVQNLPDFSKIEMPTSTTQNLVKPPLKTRPFKAFSIETSSTVVTSNNAMVFDDPELNRDYLIFREQAKSRILRNKESASANISVKSNKTNDEFKNKDGKPAEYWEKRAKNNQAAKRSRDARKEKEDELAIRASFLSSECIKLKSRNKFLEQENNHLKMLVYSPVLCHQPFLP